MALRSLGGMRRIRLMGRGRLTTGLRVVAWLMRLVVGGTFIFSGFSKAVDPYGTYYKIADYAAAMGIEVPASLLLSGAFILFGAEFVIGVMLVLGSFRRTTSLAATLVMLVMLPLSAWLALSNPVPDCGCFGDALVVSNSATFWKNVGLTGACIWLLFFNRRLHWIVTPALQWLALTLSIAYAVLVGALGYLVQPPLDFRPYAAGGPLTDVATEEEADNVRLVYADPQGAEHVFTLADTLPDGDGWKFLRQEEAASENKSPSSSGLDLRIWDENGEEDVTDAVISDEGEQLILFMPRISDVNVRDTWPINSLYRYAGAHDIDMFAVMSATPEQIAIWRDMALSEYPIYTAEDTAIKEVVRGNPALVFLKDGRIVWKQTLESLDIDLLTAPGTTLRLEDAATDTYRLTARLTYIYLFTTAILIFFSFLPPITMAVKKLRRRSRMSKGAE